jgi:hypothetical protein
MRLQKWIDDLSESSHDVLNRTILGVTFLVAIPTSYWATKGLALFVLWAFYDLGP